MVGELPRGGLAHSKPDQIVARPRAPDLLHVTAHAQPAEVDDEEARVAEQRGGVGLGVHVVTR